MRRVAVVAVLLSVFAGAVGAHAMIKSHGSAGATLPKATITVEEVDSVTVTATRTPDMQAADGVSYAAN